MATKKAMKPCAHLWWGNDTLWLGPWRAAEVKPRWYGEGRAKAPDCWWWRVGAAWEDDRDSTYDEALRSAEFVVMSQLAAVGIRSAEFRRPDGTTRTLEIP